MDNGGGDGGGSFRVEHGSDAAEVTDVHEAGAVGDHNHKITKAESYCKQ